MDTGQTHTDNPSERAVDTEPGKRVRAVLIDFPSEIISEIRDAALAHPLATIELFSRPLDLQADHALSHSYDVFVLNIADNQSPEDTATQVLAVAGDTPVVLYCGEQSGDKPLDLVGAGVHDFVRDGPEGIAKLLRCILKTAVRSQFEEVRESQREAVDALERAFNADELREPEEALLIVDQNHKIVFSSPGARKLGENEISRVLERLDETQRRWPTPGVIHDELPGPVAGAPGVAVSATWVDWKGHKVNIVRMRLAGAQRESDELESRLDNFDPLTGLPSRRLFPKIIERAVELAEQTDSHIGVMVLNVDRMKFVNEAIGHECGDQLLSIISNRLKAITRSSDHITRFSADEFAILVQDIAESSALVTVADKILSDVQRPVRVDGNVIHATVSIGIAVHPTDGVKPNELVQHADSAVARAKQNGGNTYEFYDRDMTATLHNLWQMETRLRGAAERDEFSLQYQPQIDARTGRICGVEALIRWEDEDSKMVYPDQFIPILEDTGLIVPVGEWVLDRACRQLREWHDAGDDQITMAVNLSPRQFRAPNIVERVRHTIERHRVDPARVHLEITENLLLEDADSTLEILEEMKSIGISLLIDDFGTGFSSLSYLKRLPVDGLKIDRSFVSDIPNDENDMAITLTVIDLAKHMGLKTYPEGVETAEQAEFLCDRGVDVMQGYFYSRPLDIEALNELLAGKPTFPTR